MSWPDDFPPIVAARQIGAELPLTSEISWCTFFPFREEHLLYQRGSVLHYALWSVRPDRGGGCFQIDLDEAYPRPLGQISLFDWNNTNVTGHAPEGD